MAMRATTIPVIIMTCGITAYRISDSTTVITGARALVIGLTIISLP